MSLITRCPACGTMFKVVPDQLRISEGWVRCGHCAEVFDAAAHLEQDDFPIEDEEPLDARQSKAQPAAAEVAEATDESEAFTSSITTEMEEGVPFDDPDSAQIDAEARALVEDPLDRPFELRRRDVGDAEPSTLPRGVREPDDSEADMDSESDAGLREISFVRKAGRDDARSHPKFRAALLIAALALGVLLALQVVFHHRDRLAAAAPALRPLLASLCEPLKCRIGPPRHIDAIAIDSSSFNKLRGDAYRLNVTLRNQAGVEVAMPALELTLTDAQDQAVLRRVLAPADLGPGATVIAAASEWSGSLALAVSANGTGARIAGYRLLAFYP